MVKAALSGSTELRLEEDAVKRLDDSIYGVHGMIAGIWDFALSVQSETLSWKEFAADIDHRLSNNALLTVGAKASTVSGSPWGFITGFRANF